MRKVYQSNPSSLALPFSIIMALGVAGILFCILPFSHIVNRPTRNLELRKTSATDLPPPQEEHAPPPPPEAPKKDEAPPDPQLADTPQQIPLSADLEVAAGSGGALAGFGDIRALTAAETVQQDAFDVSDLEKKPEAVSQVSPAYPAELRKAKIDGSVTLVFVLGEDGHVEEPRVENSSRPEWRFKPGIKGGQPVRTYVRIPMRFRVSSG